jgi:hypothetical protein
MRHLILLCTIVSLITGCHTPTNERNFMRHSSEQVSATKDVPYNGEYRLYPGTHHSPSAQIAKPLLQERLVKGEILGFARDASGRLMAVVGSEQKPIPDSASTSFTWTMQPDPGQNDPDRTNLLVLAAVAVVAAITLGLAATLPFGPI